MIRKFDGLGRIVIPKEMRTSVGLKEGSSANIVQEGNKIIISNPNDDDKFIDYLDDLYKSTDEKTKELLQKITKKYVEYK